jgi:hypothetical protein
VVPTSAVQRGPAGTFSYVIGDGDIATAKPVVVTQQNENDAVIASGLSPSDRVVTTGFANLSDGAKVIIGKDDRRADRRSRAAQAQPQPRWQGQGQGRQGKDGQAKEVKAKDGEHRGKKGRAGRGRSKGSNRTGAGSEQSGSGAKYERLEPFIRRPIATSLLGIALMIGGALGYWALPVSALPQVDFPTVQVTTQLPGASPDVIASLITAPLERQLGQIPSLSSMTSTSSFGVSQITLQFDLNRDIDGATQDVQAAINAAGSDRCRKTCRIRRPTPR